MIRQLDAQNQVIRGHRAQGLLMAAVPEDSGLLVLVPKILQDLGGEEHLQPDLSSLDIFLGIVKHMDHSTPDQGKSFNTMVIRMQDLEPDTVLSISQETPAFPHPPPHMPWSNTHPPGHHFQHSSHGCCAPTSLTSPHCPSSRCAEHTPDP